ncbi:NAD-P-binding protein [Multifurca ochricompacta]|uniref:NAD-P-binding protein n=1 Tax=Multifurca ochricompacta TaxID=376703 RepID=A0AAD4M2N2_9AGAM|nr:NAD-P-binding protein [Multifurca ochricompacta]
MSARPIFILAGLGNASGTGGASARVFAKAGYNIALIARQSDSIHKFAAELKTGETDAAAFPVSEYNYKEVQGAFHAVRAHWPNAEIRVALFNAGFGIWKPFLQITEEEVDRVTDTNIKAAFAFAREAITTFKGQSISERGKRGTLLFTGATASWRGNTTTSAFSAAKFALRSLSQSLNKEFGKDNIHVAHAVIDGGIVTDLSKSRRGEEWASDQDRALSPESIANSYLYLANQDRSAWTWELDLRPAHEKW